MIEKSHKYIYRVQVFVKRFSLGINRACKKEETFMATKFKLNTGMTVSYQIFGDEKGHPLVICSGLLGNISNAKMDSLLSETGIKWILIDRPGYGQSDFYEMETPYEWAEGVGQLLKELEIENFDVLGISAGAVYAYALAVAFSRRVCNVYVSSGIGAIYKPEVVALYPDEAKAVIPLYTTGTPAQIQKGLMDMFEKLPQEIYENPQVRRGMNEDIKGIVQTVRLEYGKWGFEIGQVKQSVNMYHSQADEQVPFSIAEKTKSYMKNATLHSYENEPHVSERILKDVYQEILEKSKGRE